MGNMICMAICGNGVGIGILKPITKIHLCVTHVVHWRVVKKSLEEVDGEVELNVADLLLGIAIHQIIVDVR